VINLKKQKINTRRAWKASFVPVCHPDITWPWRTDPIAGLLNHQSRDEFLQICHLLNEAVIHLKSFFQILLIKRILILLILSIISGF
jgi:hypothetical protein